MQSNILNNRKVLLVDDDERNVLALTVLLSSWNMNVVVAKNGKEYVDILNDDPTIEIVLMDIMMPIMGGYEAIRKTRKIFPYSEVPIIALTANAQTEDRALCLNAGATEYLSKPVDINQLFKVMSNLI